MIKKFLIITIIAAFSLSFLVGCSSTVSSQNDKSLKDTPIRVGTKGTISGSVEACSYDQAISGADIIAEIEILGWLSETDEPSEKTFFKAGLLKTYKNKVDPQLKEITLMQDGNSKFTIKGSPLFKKNEKLILFLKKADNQDAYWMLGAHKFKITKIEDVDYVIKNEGGFPEFTLIEVNDQKIKDKARQNLKDELVSYPLEECNFTKIYKKNLFNAKLEESVK